MHITAALHPAWERSAPDVITDGYSLEMTAKDVAALRAAAPRITPDTPIAITFLPGETMAARIEAAVLVRSLGFEPMPHLSARRITSHAELETIVQRTTAEAGARRMFLVAGDPPVPAGPFADTLSLLRTGLFERHGIRVIGIAGHPDGHPAMSGEQLWSTLEQKCADIAVRGMAPLIVTQFGFDADPFLAWLRELRRRGIDAPVRIGVPGPAGIKTLLRFAAHCGVGASASVMAKYGISLSRLLGTAGPDMLVDAFARGIGAEQGPVRLHFYPFGGLERTVDWIGGYTAAHAR
ncbi:methylenetetrahydrofolate reductase [Sphingomonas sp. PB2P19]|uniref:methylenetetrahydrofolate reductase n=1 Tax=Sphingomonas rhamnosi TaxID=3096156 RepID=UPI002FC63223